MSKHQNSERLVAILDSLSDVSVTLVTDFLAIPAGCGGVPVAIRLAELGITVFPVGVAGEDEAGQQVFQRLHEHRISTSGISKLKNYSTPSSDTGQELIHGEHPVLLNLIEHARKFAPASEAVYVCDYGIGAASPRVLNFIKSNGCIHEKTVAARSLHRLANFEQLTTAITSEAEMAEAIGVEIGGDAGKLAVAGAGIVQEMKLESLLAVSGEKVLAFRGAHKPSSIASKIPESSEQIDLMGAIFAAALSTGAEVMDAAEMAVHVSGFLLSQSQAAKRIRREELLAVLGTRSSASRVR